MKRILTAIVLIPLVVLLVFRAPEWLLTASAGLIAELAIYEFLGLADATGAQTLRWLVMALTAIPFVVVALAPALLLWCLMASAVVLLVAYSFTSPLERVLTNAAYSFFGLVYTALPLVLVPIIRFKREYGAALLLLTLVIVWTGDITALYTGRSIGRRKLAPKISPNKTWEGTVGSLVGSVLIAFLLVELGRHLAQRGWELLIYPGPVWYWLLLAVLLNVAAQVGDLVESAIKRGAGVKDSGTLLPGHGGVLDRIDALLLALPALWYALLLLQYLQQDFSSSGY